jgi:hypothetical protein
VCQSRVNALIYTTVFGATKRAFSEPLSSKRQFRNNIIDRRSVIKSIQLSAENGYILYYLLLVTNDYDSPFNFHYFSSTIVGVRVH